jgi:hypothetical protein
MSEAHDTTTTQTSRLPAFLVTNCKAISSGALKGVCDMTLQIGMTPHRCSIFAKDGRAWAAPPSKQVIGRDGTVQRPPDGKPRYEPTVSFVDRTTEQRWSAGVIEALLAAFPEVLA